ncbi:MAG TPA: GspH/FimT family pseudopilin [Anaerohalosphaeraceae bacterium]|nr:GspH/FimT family pseudopilin [Anaerohalosphaeraceae bacterium]HOL89761.1 GspH/FimT family pseudopilin [Anaerohalosphaeraceae bacterium]HPP57199.1 GspH/FimT family pseudopilin [Anaerohalosphaeraceae bacterium]
MKKTLQQNGFTLIELLAVAAVIAAAAIASTALMLRNQSKTRLLQAAQQIALTAKAARIQAVQSGQPCRLSLDRENKKVSVLPSATQEEPAEAAPIKSVQLPSSVTFEQILILSDEPTDSLEIEFQPNGSAKTAVIQLSDGKNQAAVTIHQITGRVKVTSGELTTLLLDRVDLDEEQTAVQ